MNNYGVNTYLVVSGESWIMNPWMVRSIVVARHVIAHGHKIEKRKESRNLGRERGRKGKKESGEHIRKARLTRRNTVWWEVARALAPADHRRVVGRPTRMCTRVHYYHGPPFRFSQRLSRLLRRWRAHARAYSLITLFLLPIFLLVS